MSQSRPPLEEMTLRQLRKIASLLNIPLYSRMRKAQLLKTIQIRQKNLQSDNPRDLETKKKRLKLGNIKKNSPQILFLIVTLKTFWLMSMMI